MLKLARFLKDDQLVECLNEGNMHFSESLIPLEHMREHLVEEVLLANTAARRFLDHASLQLS